MVNWFCFLLQTAKRLGSNDYCLQRYLDKTKMTGNSESRAALLYREVVKDNQLYVNSRVILWNILCNVHIFYLSWTTCYSCWSYINLNTMHWTLFHCPVKSIHLCYNKNITGAKAKVVAAGWGTELIRTRDLVPCRMIWSKGWIEERIFGRMDDFEKWMIIRFTPRKTTTITKWMSFQKNSSNHPCS